MNKQTDKNQKSSSEEYNPLRRKLVYSAWMIPVVMSVNLPAHAQTSLTNSDSIPINSEIFDQDNSTFTVPVGVTSLNVVVYGANGGRGGDYQVPPGFSPGGFGGIGGGVSQSIIVTPGLFLGIRVGQKGIDGGNGLDNIGGSGGTGGVGGIGFNNGGQGSTPTQFGGGGGGGGGSSAIIIPPSGETIVAGGGGGGGGGINGGGIMSGGGGDGGGTGTNGEDSPLPADGGFGGIAGAGGSTAVPAPNGGSGGGGGGINDGSAGTSGMAMGAAGGGGGTGSAGSNNGGNPNSSGNGLVIISW